MIPFLHAVPPEKQVQQLYKKLLEESAYIVRESVKAYNALLNNNFSLTRSEVPPEYSPGESREIVNEIQAFLSTCCEHDAQASVTTEHLYQAFISNAHSGRIQYITKISFARILAEILESDPDVVEAKRAENTEKRGYRGLRLKDSTITHVQL